MKPVVQSVDFSAVCDVCMRARQLFKMPYTRRLLGSDERVPVRVCEGCKELAPLLYGDTDMKTEGR